MTHLHLCPVLGMQSLRQDFGNYIEYDLNLGSQVTLGKKIQQYKVCLQNTRSACPIQLCLQWGTNSESMLDFLWPDETCIYP